MLGLINHHVLIIILQLWDLQVTSKKPYTVVSAADVCGESSCGLIYFLIIYALILAAGLHECKLTEFAFFSSDANGKHQDESG